jgi:Fe(3+) dicitrate transport protein
MRRRLSSVTGMNYRLLPRAIAAALALGAAAAAAQPGSRDPEIVVIGEADRLRSIPGSANVVDSEALEASRVFTINEAMRKVPGIYARDEEGFGLRPNFGIRGLNPTRSTKVLLLEDGLPLSFAPYGDNASYYHPPVDRFERIEVLKGSGQVLFGPQTIGGVINYITPRPADDLGGSLAVHAGNRGYRELHAQIGDTLESTRYSVNLTRKETDGARDNMHFEIGDLSAKVIHEFAEKHSLTLRASHYDEDSNVPYSGLTLAEYEANPRANPFVNDEFVSRRSALSLTHRADFTEQASLATSVYYTSFDRDWWRQSSNSAQRPNDSSDAACGGMANLSTGCGNEGRLREYSTIGVEPRLTLEHGLFGSRSEAEVGLRIHREDQYRVQANGDTPTSRTAGTGPNGGVVEDNSREVDATSFFLQNRFAFGEWTLTPGLRYEQVDYWRQDNRTGLAGETDVDRWIPGLGATYNLDERTTLFAGAHRGFAPPNVADIVTNAGGSVDLDPELSWNYEIGVRSTLRPGLALEGTLFRMDFENQVIAASLAGGAGATLTNAGATVHEGFEALLSLDSAELGGTRHNWYLRAAYTRLATAEFSAARFSSISGFTSVSVTGNRLPYAPENLLTLTGGVDLATGLSVELEGVYNDSAFTDDLNTVAVTANGQRGLMPSYTVWNAALNYALPESGWTLFVAAKNVTDKTYVVDMTRGLIPGAPRLVQAGFTLKF